MEPARKKKVVGFQCRLLDPRLQGLSSDSRNLELHWALGLVLHDDGSVGRRIAVGRVADFELHEVTSAKLAVDTKVEEGELANPAFHLKPYA